MLSKNYKITFIAGGIGITPYIPLLLSLPPLAFALPPAAAAVVIQYIILRHLEVKRAKSSPSKSRRLTD